MIEWTNQSEHPEGVFKSNIFLNDAREPELSIFIESPDIAEYAEKLDVSPNHLSKTIKQNTGHPVTYWINESAMMAAKMLLKNTDLTMSEIAEQLGMLDPSYFARRFRQHERMTPTDYRRIVRGNAI